MSACRARDAKVLTPYAPSVAEKYLHHRIVHRSKAGSSPPPPAYFRGPLRAFASRAATSQGVARTRLGAPPIGCQINLLAA
jgi:hypothetical protein